MLLTEMRHELQELDTSPRTLRKFGVTVGTAFLVLGGVWYLRHRAYAPVGVGLGALLLLAGLVIPYTLRLTYLAWMALAAVLGRVMTAVLLTVLFYLFLTPLSWLARMAGHDPLQRRRRAAATCWQPREKTGSTADDYERQY